jgi:hypothetical protein
MTEQSNIQMHMYGNVNIHVNEQRRLDSFQPYSHNNNNPLSSQEPFNRSTFERVPGLPRRDFLSPNRDFNRPTFERASGLPRREFSSSREPFNRSAFERVPGIARRSPNRDLNRPNFERAPGGRTERDFISSNRYFNPIFYIPPDADNRTTENNGVNNQNDLSGNDLSGTLLPGLFTTLNSSINEQQQNNTHEINNISTLLESLRNLVEEFPETEVTFRIDETIPRNEQQTNILNGRRQVEGNDELNGNNTRVSQLVNSTTVSIADENILNNEEIVCAICQNIYSENDIIRTVNECGHFYHIHCVDTWYSRNTSCPMCRNNIS